MGLDLISAKQLARFMKKMKEKGALVEDVADDVELPQEWFDINEAYEAAEAAGMKDASDHKLLGGLIYKDFDGNIKVYPLSPAYGVRTNECGKKLAAVAVYNTAQQLMVKPATDGRHTVSLRQLDEFFGGGSTSDLGEKAFSLQKIPPVDMSDPSEDNREPYVFCRDTRNNFAAKFYNEAPLPHNLIERDPHGRALVKAPDSGEIVFDDYVVNLDYLQRNYLPLSGGVMTGTHTIQNANPCLKFLDTSDNSTSYIQSYQKRLRLGYSWQKSLTVDKDGNVGVYGTLSCNTPTADGHAVTLEYLNSRLAELEARLAGLNNE